LKDTIVGKSRRLGGEQLGKRPLFDSQSNERKSVKEKRAGGAGSGQKRNSTTAAKI